MGEGRKTCAPSILSLMRSPISFTNARPLSLSLNSAQATFCNVEERSFLIYGFNWSESNLGRGDVAPERGLTGERIPENPELAMMDEICANRLNHDQAHNGTRKWLEVFVLVAK